MDIYYHLIPLYKILCISLIILVPVLPALLLYTKAPEDKIFAKGILAGFQINATGAVATYIVLFAALYVYMGKINDNFDQSLINDKRIQALTKQRDSLISLLPWNLQCQIEMVDSKGNIDPHPNLQEGSIQTLPLLLNVSSQKKLVSFYLDDATLRANINSCSISLPGSYGAHPLKFHPNKEDSANKSIFIIDTISMNSNDDSLSGNKRDTMPAYDTSQGINKLPGSPLIKSIL